MYIGVSCVEIKSEADNDDMMECSHHDKQSTGMIAVSSDRCIKKQMCSYYTS